MLDCQDELRPSELSIWLDSDPDDDDASDDDDDDDDYNASDDDSGEGEVEYKVVWWEFFETWKHDLVDITHWLSIKVPSQTCTP